MNVYLAEFVGTSLLILLGNGVVANVVLKETKGNKGGWIVITAGWGLGVAMAVYAVGRISGAHINPAVTFALASTGDFPWSQVPGYVLAQLTGGITGATLVWLTYLAHWKGTEGSGDKLACYSTTPAIRSLPANFLTEFIGTVVLIFGVLSIGSVASGFESILALETGIETGDGFTNLQTSLTAAYGTFFAPLLVGLLVFAIGLSLGGPTGYAINPARDLGPRIAHALLPIAGKGRSDWSYAWVPILAPISGGIAGAQLFVLLGF